MSSKKIVVYDSGVGGQVVFDTLRTQWQTLIEAGEIYLDYFADHQHFPYGTKSDAELQKIVRQNLQQFADQGYQSVIVACNSASLVIDRYQLQQEFPLTIATIVQPTMQKIVDLQPSAVCVIATDFTVNAHVYLAQLRSLLPQTQVIEQAEQELVKLVEERQFDQIGTEVQRIVTGLAPEEILVLACTHFSVIKKLFEWELEKQGKENPIVDSAAELVEAVNRGQLKNRD